jgi:hypothetical protein
MKLSNLSSHTMDDASKYYHDGFVLLPISHNQKIIEIMINDLLMKNTLKTDFFWETTLNSSHLRPNVFGYDDCFLNFLFDNDLPQKLEKFSCKRLTLSHIQIVKTAPGRSYQDWHRDSHQVSNLEWSGNTPPAHKIIYYPHLNNPEPRLKFIRSSHRCYAHNEQFDANLINSLENEVLMSDNNQVLMFETNMLHGVIPDINPNGSIRLIYNFITKDQYLKRYAIKDHHRILNEMYEKRMSKL